MTSEGFFVGQQVAGINAKIPLAIPGTLRIEHLNRDGRSQLSSHEC